MMKKGQVSCESDRIFSMKNEEVSPELINSK